MNYLDRKYFVLPKILNTDLCLGIFIINTKETWLAPLGNTYIALIGKDMEDMYYLYKGTFSNLMEPCGQAAK